MGKCDKNDASEKYWQKSEIKLIELLFKRLYVINPGTGKALI